MISPLPVALLARAGVKKEPSFAVIHFKVDPMRVSKPSSPLFLSLLTTLMSALLLISVPSAVQARPGEKPNEKAKPNPRVLPPLPGFVTVPKGTLHPGASAKDIARRSTNQQLTETLIYEQWSPKLGVIKMPSYYFGKFEVTNAQWKHYLDKNFKEEYIAAGGDSLRLISGKFYRVGGKPIESEWLAIYAMNWRTLIKAWKRPTAHIDPKTKEKVTTPKLWQDGWMPHEPPHDATQKKFDLSSFPIPKGTRLNVYRHRVPMHWYGWCRLSRLQVGREYFDPTKEAAKAFEVPGDAFFREMSPGLRAKDFAAFPVRSVSMNEILAFCEWAGLHLPSEFQYERALRGNRANSFVHTTPGAWNSHEQKNYYAWQNNKAVRRGPMAVDDPSVAKGDTMLGARHALGNVWEVMRTFYDVHPRLNPKPAPPNPDLTNYALIAKGGSFGDRSAFVQISARTPNVGKYGDLSLDAENRIDTVGFRLVRDTQPGMDLILHSRLRMVYDKGNSKWFEPYPHQFAVARIGGVDRIHMVDAPAPYIHVMDKASGIAFLPLHQTNFDARAHKFFMKKGKKFDPDSKIILGILRSDVALRVGRRMSAADRKKLMDQRKAYKDWERKYKAASKKKKAEIKAEEPIKPPPPDEYEKFSRPLEAQIGLWREADLKPGEWFVVYWNGTIGLLNKALIMPPEGMVFVDPRKDIKRLRQRPTQTQFELDMKAAEIKIAFEVEEMDAKPKRGQTAPGPDRSEEWALAEARPDGWLDRPISKHCWHFKVTFPVKNGVDLKPFGEG